MLGELKDVIGNLAVSVNDLKDVVSNLRAKENVRENPGSGSVWRSGKGKERALGGERDGNGGEQSHNIGGSAGEDFAAGDQGGGNGGDGDDEGDGNGGDGNQVEQKDFKMRVSARPKSAGTGADGNSE